MSMPTKTKAEPQAGLLEFHLASDPEARPHHDDAWLAKRIEKRAKHHETATHGSH
ncbi:MAG: hypothetical protein ACYDCK_05055 [Thermoplasmatota archaeon]